MQCHEQKESNQTSNKKINPGKENIVAHPLSINWIMSLCVSESTIGVKESYNLEFITNKQSSLTTSIHESRVKVTITV